MKLRAPEGYSYAIDADGISHQVMNGVIEIQDAAVPDSLWGLGFVRVEEAVAINRMPKLAAD